MGWSIGNLLLLLVDMMMMEMCHVVRWLLFMAVMKKSSLYVRYKVQFIVLMLELGKSVVHVRP